MYNQYDLYRQTNLYPQFHHPHHSRYHMQLQLKKPSFLIRGQDNPFKTKLMNSSQRQNPRRMLSPQSQHRIDMIQKNPFLKTSQIVPKSFYQVPSEESTWSTPRQIDENSHISKSSIIGQLITHIRDDNSRKYQPQIPGQYYSAIGKFNNQSKKYTEQFRTEPIIHVIHSQVKRKPSKKEQHHQYNMKNTEEYHYPSPSPQDSPERLIKTANRAYPPIDQGRQLQYKNNSRPLNPLDILAQQTPSIFNMANQDPYQHVQHVEPQRYHKKNAIASSQVNEVYQRYSEKEHVGIGVEEGDPLSTWRKDSTDNKHPQTINVRGVYFHLVPLS